MEKREGAECFVVVLLWMAYRWHTGIATAIDAGTRVSEAGLEMEL